MGKQPDANHQHNRPDDTGRPSIAAALTNLRSNGLPWHRRLAAVVANNWRKLRSRQNCCGNLGQPGC